MWEGKHGCVYRLHPCQTVFSKKKETFPSGQERMPWKVAFLHCRWDRWHLFDLWSSQFGWWSADSLVSCTKSVREVHNLRLPCDLPVKYASWWKLRCVPDFYDFHSWKHLFHSKLHGKSATCTWHLLEKLTGRKASNSFLAFFCVCFLSECEMSLQACVKGLQTAGWLKQDTIYSP